MISDALQAKENGKGQGSVSRKISPPTPLNDTRLGGEERVLLTP